MTRKRLFSEIPPPLLPKQMLRLISFYMGPDDQASGQSFTVTRIRYQQSRSGLLISHKPCSRADFVSTSV